HVLQFDAIGEPPGVGASAGTLEGDEEFAVVFLDGHPAELHVAEPDQAVGSPVLQLIRKHVGVHERAPVLTRAEMSQLAPGMAQPERRLARIDANAEQLELENRFQFSILGRRIRLDTESALTNALPEVTVLSELFIERWQLGWPHGVEPIGVVLFEIKD